MGFAELDFGGVWGSLGRLLAASWAVFGASWALLGRVLGALGCLLSALGRFLGAALEIPPLKAGKGGATCVSEIGHYVFSCAFVYVLCVFAHFCAFLHGFACFRVFLVVFVLSG